MIQRTDGHRRFSATVRTPFRVAHVLHGRLFPSGAVVLVAAACFAPPAPPQLAPPGLVEIRAGRSAPASALRPAPTRRSVRIGFPPTQPLRPWVAPAVVIEGRVWCPRHNAAGGASLAVDLPELQPEAVVRVEVLGGPEARRYAARCTPPADSVVRVVTRRPPVR